MGEPPMWGAPDVETQTAILDGMAVCVEELIAGDHLISHTVSRAVPSAQRGLTSVFGMGTGDPSQYGHRQTWMALGGLVCPQQTAASRSPGSFLPGPTRNAAASWRHKKSYGSRYNEVDWYLQGLCEEYPRTYCAELILWTSRTGD
jgi:hypothetical protein